MMKRLRSCSKKTKRLGYFIILGLVLIYHWIYQSPDYSKMKLNKCKIDMLNPWDDSLKDYFVELRPLNCSKRHQMMFVDRDGYLRFNNTAMYLNKLHASSLKCMYRTMKREIGDVNVTFRSEVPFTVPVFVESHVFRVTCLNHINETVYDYLHNNPFWDDYSRGKKDIETENALSLIVFGIDSISRSHALRYLPKSYNFLKEKFNMYDFIGYRRVGENTWRNIVPLLTGKSSKNFREEGHGRQYVDSMPFIWKEKAMENFATFYAEDRPFISTFNFGKMGFKHEPTDFYFHPYDLGMLKFKPKIIDFFRKPPVYCYGVNNYFDIQIDYLKGFLNKYKNERKFAFFHNNQVSHDQFTISSTADNSLLKFLKWMKITNQTKHAVLIMISDHGFRLGGASMTYIGRAEKNRPWLMIHIPEYLKLKYKWLHRTLLENTRRLTSHYDIYQTMFDLVHNVAFMKHKNKPVKTELVRRNVFHDIPIERTCDDAGIEIRYCTCNKKVNISTASYIVKAMANFLVGEINFILKKQLDVCSVLDLYDVKEASILYSNKREENNTKLNKQTRFLRKVFQKDNKDLTGRYYLLFTTIPGYAFFEGIVDFSEIGPKGEASKMTMVEKPSRLNIYGTQSYCVNDPFLKLFCFCKNFKSDR